MRFGASSWPFQWDPPYEDAIRRVAGTGFKAIELIAWNVDFLENYWTKPKIGDMKRELKNCDIALSQFVHTPHDVGYDGTVSIELEDVPGVSRGPNSGAPGVYRNVTATDEFVAETVAGMNYLKDICRDLGIGVE